MVRGPGALWIGALMLIGDLSVAHADVYKYVDGSGNVYFTDTPLKGSRYQLEWHRESKRLVTENRRRSSIASGSRRRTIVSAPSGSQAERRAAYDRLIRANAARYRLPPALLHAVIRAESGYRPRAVSSAGARGLMQLMPATAARYGVRDSFDPAQNIRGGAAYLRDLLNMFDQNVRLALAGYNAGEGAVIKYGRKIPPYSETQNYVRKVVEYYRAERPTAVIMSAGR